MQLLPVGRDLTLSFGDGPGELENKIVGSLATKKNKYFTLANPNETVW